MAQDVAPERPLARKARKLAVAHERLHADDRVVPPVLGVAELPPVESGGEHRSVDVVGELLGARDERLPVHSRRRGLQDADIGAPLHDLHDPDHRRPLHDAVRVEDDHVAVVLSPAAAEVRDVAALALDVGAALAVEDMSEGVERRTEVVPRLLLRHPDVRVRGVAQDEDIEAIPLSGLRERLVRRPDARHDAVHVLVVDRDQDRRPRVRVGKIERKIPYGFGHGEAVFAAQQHEKAQERRPEADGDPREQNREDHDEHDLERGPSLVGEDLRHGPARDECREDHERDQEDAPPACAPVPGDGQLFERRHGRGLTFRLRDRTDPGATGG